MRRFLLAILAAFVAAWVVVVGAAGDQPMPVLGSYKSASITMEHLGSVEPLSVVQACKAGDDQKVMNVCYPQCTTCAAILMMAGDVRRDLLKRPDGSSELFLRGVVIAPPTHPPKWLGKENKWILT